MMWGYAFQTKLDQTEEPNHAGSASTCPVDGISLQAASALIACGEGGCVRTGPDHVAALAPLAVRNRLKAMRIGTLPPARTLRPAEATHSNLSQHRAESQPRYYRYHRLSPLPERADRAVG